MLQFQIGEEVYVLWHSSFTLNSGPGPHLRPCEFLCPCAAGATFATCDPYAGYTSTAAPASPTAARLPSQRSACRCARTAACHRCWTRGRPSRTMPTTRCCRVSE